MGKILCRVMMGYLGIGNGRNHCLVHDQRRTYSFAELSDFEKGIVAKNFGLNCHEFQDGMREMKSVGLGTGKEHL